MSGSEADSEDEEGVLRRHRDRALVDEWLLVLAADGFRVSVHHADGVFVVRVPASEREAAARALEHWEAENASTDRPEPPAPEPIGAVERLSAFAVGLAMLAFWTWTGPADAKVAWFARGAGDSSAILDGELWRTLTALSLHVDLGHVAANALFGTLFLAAAGAGFGPGLALALSLLAGAMGNLANAIFQGPGHVTIGASTAVFGAVGLLAGRALALRLRRGDPGMRAWIPIAAGFALLAMLGTGERSDVWAHLFGFLSGGFLGVPATLAWPRPARWPVQLAAFCGACAAMLQAWRLALA